MKRVGLVLCLASAAAAHGQSGHGSDAESSLARPERGCPDVLQWKIGYDYGEGFLSSLDASMILKGSVAEHCPLKASSLSFNPQSFENALADHPYFTQGQPPGFLAPTPQSKLRYGGCPIYYPRAFLDMSEDEAKMKRERTQRLMTADYYVTMKRLEMSAKSALELIANVDQMYGPESNEALGPDDYRRGEIFEALNPRKPESWVKALREQCGDPRTQQAQQMAKLGSDATQVYARLLDPTGVGKKLSDERLRVKIHVHDLPSRIPDEMGPIDTKKILQDDLQALADRKEVFPTCLKESEGPGGSAAGPGQFQVSANPSKMYPELETAADSMTMVYYEQLSPEGQAKCNEIRTAALTVRAASPWLEGMPGMGLETGAEAQSGDGGALHIDPFSFRPTTAGAVDSLLRKQWTEARRTALEIYRKSVNAALCLNRARGCQAPEVRGLTSTAYNRLYAVVEDALQMAPELDFTDRPLEEPYKDLLEHTQCKQRERAAATAYNQKFAEKASFYVGMATLALGPGTAAARGLVQGGVAIAKFAARRAVVRGATAAVTRSYTGMQVRAARLLVEVQKAAPRASALAARMGTNIAKVPSSLFRFSDMADLALTAPALAASIEGCKSRSSATIKEPPDWAPACAVERTGQYQGAVSPSQALVTMGGCITNVALHSIGLLPIASMLKR